MAKAMTIDRDMVIAYLISMAENLQTNCEEETNLLCDHITQTRLLVSVFGPDEFKVSQE